MIRFPRLTISPFLGRSLALSVALLAAGCQSNQPAATTDQGSIQQPAGDPAAANLAPVSDTSSAAAPSTDQDTVDEASYGEQPEYTAPQPPPQLPDYDQPPAPGDGYIWTPGYWGWASGGYYWVPGAWVEPPNPGALWTPGYWGWRNNHYAFYHGYWGPHIGFYGGVNYGFGYVGTGYQGGYWNHGAFYYNRSVNNVNMNVVHNVYNFNIVKVSNVRVSFNGGPGGIALRPRPAELAAWHEPHVAPMQAQVANMHTASLNHAQFYNVNHGRPQSFVVSRPIPADRGVQAQAMPIRQAPAMQQHQAPQQYHTAPGHEQAAPERRQPAAQSHQQPQHQQPQHQQPAPQRHEAAPQHSQPQHKPDEHHPE